MPFICSIVHISKKLNLTQWVWHTFDGIVINLLDRRHIGLCCCEAETFREDDVEILALSLILVPSVLSTILKLLTRADRLGKHWSIGTCGLIRWESYRFQGLCTVNSECISLRFMWGIIFSLFINCEDKCATGGIFENSLVCNSEVRLLIQAPNWDRETDEMRVATRTIEHCSNEIKLAARRRRNTAPQTQTPHPSKVLIK